MRLSGGCGWLPWALVGLVGCASGLAAIEWQAADLQVTSERHAPIIERLFGSIDLDRPELAEVRVAWENGDLALAGAELLNHYAGREQPAQSWLPPFTAAASAVERADDVLRDRFHIQGATGKQPRTPEGGLDWEARGPHDDPEWSWLLNRHAYFESLSLAYQQTGDTRYLERLSEDLVDWVATHPYPDRLTFSAAWRPLEVARRILDSWTNVFFGLQKEPAFSAEARLLLLSSLPQHADSLAHHYSFWGGNHLLTETTALATIAVAWPEFKASGNWLNLAIDRFHDELGAQVYPDGAFQELTNHYQKIVWLGAERFNAILDATELDDPAVDSELKKRLAAMRRYFEGVMRPDGRGPLNNAADLEHNAWQLEQLGVERTFPTTPLRGGRESPMLYFPWAGHAVMRDRWEGGREWAFFDMGPFGSAHQHRDALHLNVWFDDQLFLADSGRFTYQPGPWADYFKGPRAHNVILLDGAPPLPGPRTVESPLPNHTVISDDFAWFSGRAAFDPSAFSGSGPAMHERAVVYLPGTGWLIVDQVLATGTHKLETIWNFGPEVTKATAAAHLRLIAARDHRGPLRMAEDIYVRGETEPIAGWYSAQFGQKVPSFARHTLFYVSGRSVFVWAIPVDPETEVDAAEHPEAKRIAVRFGSESHGRTVDLRFTPEGIRATPVAE